MKLQRITTILLILALVFACKKDADKTKVEADTVTEQTSVASQLKEATSEIKNCDDFLNTYEKWANNLIDLMAKHKDDPVTLATSPEYINTMMESSNFLKDWQTIAVSCSQNNSYEKRMKGIQEKLNKKQKELGLK